MGCASKPKDGVREVFEMGMRAALQARYRKEKSGYFILGNCAAKHSPQAVNFEELFINLSG